ncbi:MAG: hypothetical protein OEV42_00455 [Deltaproteobacteria bacterium]|nr:hypothetical protein [Deltaproteobacteria bacterium]
METFINIFVSWFPMILLIAVWVLMVKKIRPTQKESVSLMRKQAELLEQHLQQAERIASALEKISQKLNSE